MFADGVILKWV